MDSAMLHATCNQIRMLGHLAACNAEERVWLSDCAVWLLLYLQYDISVIELDTEYSNYFGVGWNDNMANLTANTAGYPGKHPSKHKSTNSRMKCV